MRFVPRWWKVPPLSARLFFLFAMLGGLAWAIYINVQH